MNHKTNITNNTYITNTTKLQLLLHSAFCASMLDTRCGSSKIFFSGKNARTESALLRMKDTQGIGQRERWCVGVLVRDQVICRSYSQSHDGRCRCAILCKRTRVHVEKHELCRWMSLAQQIGGLSSSGRQKG